MEWLQAFMEVPQFFKNARNDAKCRLYLLLDYTPPMDLCHIAVIVCLFLRQCIPILFFINEDILKGYNKSTLKRNQSVGLFFFVCGNLSLRAEH